MAPGSSPASWRWMTAENAIGYFAQALKAHRERVVGELALQPEFRIPDGDGVAEQTSRHDGRGDGSFRWTDANARTVGVGWKVRHIFTG